MRKPDPIRPTAAPAGPKPRALKPRPPLPIDEPAPDPFMAVEFSEDPEVASEQQLDALSAGFRERAKAEAERFKSATATDYYCTLVFRSGAQVEAFFAAAGMPNNERFVDGCELADRLGFTLPEASVPKLRDSTDPKLTRLVIKPGA